MIEKKCVVLSKWFIFELYIIVEAAGSLPLEDTAGTHSGADAHADNTEALLSALKFAKESANHAAASHTKWVTESNGSSTWVKFLLGNAKLFNAVGSLRSKGLVNLKNVNVIHAKSTFLESSRDGESWSNTHDLGRNTSSGEAQNTSIDTASKLIGYVSAGKHDA